MDNIVNKFKLRSSQMPHTLLNKLFDIFTKHFHYLNSSHLCWCHQGICFYSAHSSWLPSILHSIYMAIDQWKFILKTLFGLIYVSLELVSFPFFWLFAVGLCLRIIFLLLNLLEIIQFLVIPLLARFMWWY